MCATFWSFNGLAALEAGQHKDVHDVTQTHSEVDNATIAYLTAITHTYCMSLRCIYMKRLTGQYHVVNHMTISYIEYASKQEVFDREAHYKENAIQNKKECRCKGSNCTVSTLFCRSVVHAD